MRINGQPLSQFLAFWRKIRPREREEDSPEWVAATESAMGRLPDDALDPLIDDWRRSYEETETVRSSVTSRASGLLLVVGVLNGLAALTATTISGAHPALAMPFVVLAVALGYFAVGTAVLAIRAQQVATWERPHIRPTEIPDQRHALLMLAREFYTAARRNRHVLADIVGYLRDAQAYALMTIALLAALTVIAGVTALTKPIPTGGPLVAPSSGVSTPTPTATSVPTPSSGSSTPAAPSSP